MPDTGLRMLVKNLCLQLCPVSGIQYKMPIQPVTRNQNPVSNYQPQPCGEAVLYHSSHLSVSAWHAFSRCLSASLTFLLAAASRFRLFSVSVSRSIGGAGMGLPSLSIATYVIYADAMRRLSPVKGLSASALTPISIDDFPTRLIPALKVRISPINDGL